MKYRRCASSSLGFHSELSLPLLVTLAAFGCSAANSEPLGGLGRGTGGGSGGGVSSATVGGFSSAGGPPASATGGIATSASGGTTPNGGATSAGGTAMSASGGTVPNGGATSAGGTATSASGGTVPNGGVTSTGGTTTLAATGGYAGNATTGGTSTGGGSAGMGGAILPSECLAFWDFESIVDGKVPDVSGHGLQLIVSPTTLIAGPRGNYLSLSGANSSAVASAPVIDTTASFSISVWVRLDKMDTYDTLVSQDGQNISAFYLQKRSSGRLALSTFPVDDVAAAICLTEGAVQPKSGEWYHLVATRDAATHEQRLYVDGMLSGATTCAGGFATTAPLVVGRGRWQTPADWTTGGIDELCVSNRVLTPEQAVNLYQNGRPSGKNYLFAYFAEQALGRGDGLRLAQSHDALYWGAIGGSKVFLPPTVGGKSFRDPHVMRDPRGVYHLVWTTSCVPWAEPGCVEDKGFGHAQSTDLVHWSEPSYVPIALNVEHVWAPETIYDSVGEQYMVYWSSPVDNAPNSADPHSIYYLLTKDFVSFSNPAVLYSRSGRNFIDATITRQSSGYLMFLKDEANGQKNIRALTSTALYGAAAWTTEPSNPLTGSYAAEGPSPLIVGSQMYLFFDKYGEGTYGALCSNGLAQLAVPASWTDASSSVFFAGVRHGTPIEVPWDAYRAVALKAGE